MYFHGYENGGALLSVGFGLTAFAMIFWFRDVILEGTKKIKIAHLTRAEPLIKGGASLINSNTPAPLVVRSEGPAPRLATIGAEGRQPFPNKKKYILPLRDCMALLRKFYHFPYTYNLKGRAILLCVVRTSKLNYTA